MVSKVQFEKIALSFEGAEKGTSFGHPAIVIGKSFFTRHRAEDNSAVVILGSLDEREMLLEVEPETFHITPHYKNYPAVLVRLEKIDAKGLRGLLTRQHDKLMAKTKKKRPAKEKPAAAKTAKTGRKTKPKTK
jgi:hypothetical protein